MDKLTEQEFNQIKDAENLVDDNNFFVVFKMKIFIFILYVLEIDFSIVCHQDASGIVNILNLYKHLSRINLIIDDRFYPIDWLIKFNDFNGYRDIVQWAIREDTLLLYVEEFIEENNIELGIQSQRIKEQLRRAITDKYMENT